MFVLVAVLEYSLILLRCHIVTKIKCVMGSYANWEVMTGKVSGLIEYSETEDVILVCFLVF